MEKKKSPLKIASRQASASPQPRSAGLREGGREAAAPVSVFLRLGVLSDAGH